MKNRGSWLARLAEETELDQEPLPGRTILEICGETRVLIENHGGVRSYAREEICVRTSFGLFCIRGQNLEFSKISRQQLVIRGCIHCVNLIRGAN